MLLNRRRLALFLIILGLLLLGFGAWILFGLFRKAPTTDTAADDANRELQIVDRGQKQNTAPQKYSMPTTVTGTSTAEQIAQMKVSPYREAIRRAESVVGRMGSGTSQDGFLGLADVASDGTARFRSYLVSLQEDLKKQHPADGPLYGMTTRVVSSKVTEGEESSDKLVISIQAQKTEDAGNRAAPTGVVYEESKVTMLKQADGFFLVDEVITKALEL